ncbi:hypothetical protein PHSY_002105 [Pseudozyma hubeiensis SY62]|uniref:Uncharacterized protein n=1 Tax=Pseudozyma hubeiensis (strain SY62) TaxID=1305764 RepID=R9P023_PSEHS|nr:hypothetical protein PHSY_002105 [Pseudozyma hubeiensis SY62]GAC94533.1 hypothetical protein PHSY_002105 [Pseudozyma hubeiensis SY62]
MMDLVGKEDVVGGSHFKYVCHAESKAAESKAQQHERLPQQMSPQQPAANMSHWCSGSSPPDEAQGVEYLRSERKDEERIKSDRMHGDLAEKRVSAAEPTMTFARM